MTRTLIPLLALSLACTAGPDAPDDVQQPPSDVPEVQVPDEGGAVPDRVPVTVPTEPALSSFTGQGTHLGIGLWCAFYPLGWSDSGRFAWATERRVNDMAIEYGAIWHVMQAGAESVDQENVGFGTEEFPEDATLAWAWEQQKDRVSTLLGGALILAGGTALHPLPAETPMGKLDARWELGELADFARPGKLLIRWDDGPETAILETEFSDLAGEPEPPQLILSPTHHHGVLVIPVVTGEPVEALVDVQYRLHGLELVAAAPLPPVTDQDQPQEQPPPETPPQQ